ncbi:MAG: hypothetical protein ACHP84_02710 [Caulobacterales bacterium]
MSRHFSVHTLLADPLVVVAYGGVTLPDAVAHTAARAAGAVAHLFVRPTWHGPGILRETLGMVGQAQSDHPNLRTVLLAATHEDAGLFRRAGLDAFHCNHNALVDERRFAPDLDAAKTYNAVYTARLVPFKRHELAVKVPRLAVITHGFEVDDAYAIERIAAFDDLKFINYEAGKGFHRLVPDEVREILVASRCGLALSAVEGPMYASVEYLLCGLPVVTTSSLGGRDEFFHADYVETVDPTPEAVEGGVGRILARTPDPMSIRRRTLELFKPHRARLIMRLSAIAEADLFAAATPSLWLPCFADKLEDWGG